MFNFNSPLSHPFLNTLHPLCKCNPTGFPELKIKFTIHCTIKVTIESLLAFKGQSGLISRKILCNTCVGPPFCHFFLHY